jgi:GTP-binding protein
VVQTRHHESFVVADIPGLIEGAHQGAGLGHDFLRHIERTRVLVFVLDTAETEGRDCLQDYLVLRQELEAFNPELAARPFLIAANKMDLPEAQANLKKLQDEFGNAVLPISAATGQGTDILIDRVWQLLSLVPREKVLAGEAEVVRRFEEEEPFTIEKIDGVFEVKGKRIEKLVAMTNFDTDDGLQRFQRIIEKIGLEEALRNMGIQEGDTVRIKDLEFEYSE